MFGLVTKRKAEEMIAQAIHDHRQSEPSHWRFSALEQRVQGLARAVDVSDGPAVPFDAEQQSKELLANGSGANFTAQPFTVGQVLKGLVKHLGLRVVRKLIIGLEISTAHAKTEPAFVEELSRVTITSEDVPKKARRARSKKRS